MHGNEFHLNSWFIFFSKMILNRCWQFILCSSFFGAFSHFCSFQCERASFYYSGPSGELGVTSGKILQ